jgi:nucleotide-binding universal stress UspA family protein
MGTEQIQGFKKIMVAYDGSKDSGRAVDLACSLADKYGSELLIVHCYTTPLFAYPGIGSVPVPNYNEFEAVVKETGRKVLTEGLDRASELGVRAKGELLGTTSVLQALVDFAVKEKVDLIVAGTRGMTGFKKLMLGSVSGGLTSHAPCTVLVVR